MYSNFSKCFINKCQERKFDNRGNYVINIQNHKPGAGEIATIWTSAALGVWAILIGDCCCCEEFKGVEGILVCCCTIVGM